MITRIREYFEVHFLFNCKEHLIHIVDSVRDDARLFHKYLGGVGYVGYLVGVFSMLMLTPYMIAFIILLIKTII